MANSTLMPILVISNNGTPNHTMKMKSRRFSMSSIWKCSHPLCIAHPQSARTIFCRCVQRPLWIFIVTLGLLNLLRIATTHLSTLLPDLELITFSRTPSPFSTWSTHGVIPVRCHSHNDYWRHVPLHSALSAGCISVEADVWPWRDQILVGHSRFTVLRGTLGRLYLEPLVDMLDLHNREKVEWDAIGDGDGDDIVGVFANDPKQTLVLLIDFKSDGESLWSLLSDALTPIRDRGYLTHFNGSGVVMRPVTIVASGDISFSSLVRNTTYRDIFYDAPLDNLAQFPVNDTTMAITDQVSNDSNGHLTDSPFNPNNSYYASVDFRKAIGPLQLGRLSETQLKTLRGQVHAAHELGLKVRYWGNPSWPIGLRDCIWNVLVHEGVDVINTDDLRGVTRQVWKDSSWWW